MNRENRFIIVCECGCDEGFIFHRTEECIYVSSIASCFYAARPLFSREAKKNYLKKDAILAGIITTREDLILLREWLTSKLLEESDYEVSENEAVLIPSVERDWDIWELDLRLPDEMERSNKPGAYADVFDVMLDQDRVNALVKRLDEILN